MVLFAVRWMKRVVILGVKHDECQACHRDGPHLIVRKATWLTIVWIPVVLLRLSHGLLCPVCGEDTSLGFLQVRQALKTGRLPLDRQRPRYEAAVRSLLGRTDPGDWRELGLQPGVTSKALKTRWRELAMTHHPDHGGEAQIFVRMEAAYRRLSAAREIRVSSVPDPKDLFDPIVKNSKRGFHDAYLKVWPVLFAMFLIHAAMTPSPTAGSPGAQKPFLVPDRATAHVCWATDNGIVGCQDDTATVMLFGSTSGRQVTCYFAAPLPEGEPVICPKT
jgi:hypothetical protein